MLGHQSRNLFLQIDIDVTPLTVKNDGCVGPTAIDSTILPHVDVDYELVRFGIAIISVLSPI